MLTGGDAHAEQQLTGTRFGRVAIVFGEAGLEFRCVHVIVFGGLRVGIDRVLLLHTGPHLVVAHHHHVEHTHVFKGELVLAQEGHALARIERHIAATGLQYPGENLHEGGLAGAVRADQAVTVTVAELDADVFKQGLGPELHGDVVGDEHSGILDSLRHKGKVALNTLFYRRNVNPDSSKA